jgi:hypothetical protein
MLTSVSAQEKCDPEAFVSFARWTPYSVFVHGGNGVSVHLKSGCAEEVVQSECGQGAGGFGLGLLSQIVVNECRW